MAKKGVVALSGASGFVGSRLMEELKKRGYEVWPLVRATGGGEGEIFYDYKRGIIDRERLAQCSAVIHLAGKNIMAGVWTKALKQELWESRVASTKLIAGVMAELGDQGPRVLICASAVGFYGETGEEKVDEMAPRGLGFLAELCEEWEGASRVAKDAGIRVVNTRFGIVLGREGGMLKGLEGLFNIGLGATLGSGKQYVAVVAVEDVVGAVIFALENKNMAGPVNVVCPQVLSNEKFTRLLGAILKKPVWLRVPAWVLKALGEQGQMLLSSCRAVPKVLTGEGYSFLYPQVRQILKHVYKNRD